MFHKVLQLSCELEYLIRCLRAVPANTNFAKSGGQERAKEARHDESWKYIEENCTVGNDAAAVCAKHGGASRASHPRASPDILPGTSQGVGIAALLENRTSPQGATMAVCVTSQSGMSAIACGLEPGAAEDADLAWSAFR